MPNSCKIRIQIHSACYKSFPKVLHRICSVLLQYYIQLFSEFTWLWINAVLPKRLISVGVDQRNPFYRFRERRSLPPASSKETPLEVGRSDFHQHQARRPPSAIPASLKSIFVGFLSTQSLEYCIFQNAIEGINLASSEELQRKWTILQCMSQNIWSLF